MKWIDDDHEMKWFVLERNVKYYRDGSKFREFHLYNVRSGNIFYKLKIYEDGSNEIQTLHFFEDIKNEIHTLILKDLNTENPHSYNQWILPLFRNKKLHDLGI